MRERSRKTGSGSGRFWDMLFHRTQASNVRVISCLYHYTCPPLSSFSPFLSLTLLPPPASLLSSLNSYWFNCFSTRGTLKTHLGYYHYLTCSFTWSQSCTQRHFFRSASLFSSAFFSTTLENIPSLKVRSMEAQPGHTSVPVKGREGGKGPREFVFFPF